MPLASTAYSTSTLMCASGSTRTEIFCTANPTMGARRILNWIAQQALAALA
jgi:hypothetical protein